MMQLMLMLPTPITSHELYKMLSKSTRRNLAMLDESVIDYELIEALIDLIDAQHGPGAILVFLPGTRCPSNFCCCNLPHHYDCEFV